MGRLDNRTALVTGSARGLGEGIARALAREGAVVVCADVIDATPVGKAAWPGWGIYSASKAAVIAITQVMALELAPYGVTVNCICPGTMVTDMMRTGFGEAARSAGRDVDELIREKAESIPLGRMGTPEDMGNMAAWIASDEACYTTGAAFNLTGGEQVFF